MNKEKCTCVPSGMCHSSTLLGCPHPHYYDANGIWTCRVNYGGDPNHTCPDWTLIASLISQCPNS